MFCVCGVQVKENSKKDKIGSKPVKNGKRGEARKSQKQLQWTEEEKLKKTQKEGPKMQSLPKFYERKKKEGLKLQFCESYNGISIPLAVGTPSTGSGKLYFQWELSSSSGNALCILFPTHIAGDATPSGLNPYATARALIDIHGEEMILRDGDERLTLNMRHDTSSYSNQPHKESINMINIYNDSYEDYLEDLFATNHLSGNPTFSSHTNLTSSKVINPLSGNTTSSSPDHLLKEFVDELALIKFPQGNDDLPFDIESDLREIKYFLYHDPTKEIDSILEDLVDKCNLADPNNNLVDTIHEMFTDEHTLSYSSSPLYDDVDDDLVEHEFDNDDVYDDPFDFKEDKIKESKLLIDELDPPRSSDFLPSLEYDSVLYEDFSEVDTLPSTNNEEKVFNPGILIHENLFEVTIRVTTDKNVKKITIYNASLILEDFNPPLYKLPFHKEVLGSLVFI
nr:hypothetical protein [Tanacetum cinerariifolium]